MPSVEANGITIEYEVRGEGEPLLFVMGLGCQLVDWPDEFVDLFVAEGYQAILFDNRDAGLSTQSTWDPPSQKRIMWAMFRRRGLEEAEYDLPEMAGDAAGLLDALNIASAHVVGVSMGGMIGQELAIGHPGRVRSLCSIMSNAGDRKYGRVSTSFAVKARKLPKPTRENAVDGLLQLFTMISGPHFDPEEYRAMAERRVARSFTPRGRARQAAAIVSSRDRTPHLAAVTAPTLVIHGLVDPLVRASGGIATARAVPGSRLVAYPDMGHDLPRPRWPEIRDEIIENCLRAG